MKHLSKSRGALALALMSAFMLVFSMFQPVSTVAAGEAARVQVTQEIVSQFALSDVAQVDGRQHVISGQTGLIQFQTAGGLEIVTSDVNGGPAPTGSCYALTVSPSFTLDNVLDTALGMLGISDPIGLVAALVDPALQTVDGLVNNLIGGVFNACAFTLTNVVGDVVGQILGPINGLLGGLQAIPIIGGLAGALVETINGLVLDNIFITVYAAETVPPTVPAGCVLQAEPTVTFSLSQYLNSGVILSAPYACPAQDGSDDAADADADAADADAADADADAADADAADADAADADAADADAADADAADADAADAAADAADADAADADAADADADADAADADAADADAADADAADAADADAADADAADADDGTDVPTGSVSVSAYECATIGSINLEYKNSSEPAADATGCDPGSVSLTFTSVETGAVYTMVVGASISTSQMTMPQMQVAGPQTVLITGTEALEVPVGTYNVAISGTNVSLVIDVVEGAGNPNLVASVLAQSQSDPTPKPTQTPGGVSELPSTGSGIGGSQIFWPAAAAASVLMLLAGQFVVGSVRSRK